MATPRPLESSPSTLPFSIENILRGRDRKSIGSPHSAFRRCAKNGISQPVADQISVPFCIERFEVTDPAVSDPVENHSSMSSCRAEKWLEEQYPHLLSGKRLKSKFTDRQVTALEHVFGHKPYIMGRERRALAKQVGLSELQVKTWFQNKRQKYRRLNPNAVEPDCERAKGIDIGTDGEDTEAVEEHNGH